MARSARSGTGEAPERVEGSVRLVDGQLLWPAYRMHTPRWATAPTSCAGAAIHDGRANRPGTQALYLALEPETAVREYKQLSPLMPPGTLVSYTVRVAPVVDFRAEYDGARWSELWEEFHCDWRELWLNQRGLPVHREPIEIELI